MLYKPNPNKHRSKLLACIFEQPLSTLSERQYPRELQEWHRWWADDYTKHIGRYGHIKGYRKKYGEKLTEELRLYWKQRRDYISKHTRITNTTTRRER